MTPADELRAAAERLRDSMGMAGIVDADIADPLSDWLDVTANYYAPGPTHPTHVVHALAVTRAILGQPDGSNERPAPAVVEHCVHSRAMHDRHHQQHVEGCPWCVPADTTDVNTGGLL